MNIDIRTYYKLMGMSDSKRNKLFKTRMMIKHEEKVKMKMNKVTEVSEIKK